MLSCNPGKGLKAGLYMLGFRVRVTITAVASVGVVLKVNGK